jgi:hypothetical protein
MFYVYPEPTFVMARRRYQRPYAAPISVRSGEVVQIDRERSSSTDLFGWLWCRGPDGREGWTPEAWLEVSEDQGCATRDFSALELDLEPGERLQALFAESGFIFARKEGGEEGWAPDGLIVLAGPD